MCSTSRKDDSRMVMVESSSKMSETAESSGSLKMAIIGPGAPTPEFTTQFVDKLQDALISAMYAVEDDHQVPVFGVFELSKQKYIRVTCVNQFSKRWLIDQVKQLSPFEETSLLAVEEETVPELRDFYVNVPKSAMPNTDDLLKRIKRSNPNLKTEFWKIRKLIQYPNGTSLKIEMDTHSIRLIEEMGYEVYVGMSRAYFWDYTIGNGHPQAQFFQYQIMHGLI